jgi:KDO2-lipid IV(A) lauroyltransferase
MIGVLTQVQYRIEAAAAWLVIALLRSLGPVRASNLAGAVARAIGPLLPVTRVGDANLRRAMPDMDAATRAATLKTVWDNLGRVAAELPHVSSLGPAREGPGYEVVGEQHIRDAAAGPGPVIFFSGHIGNWETLPVIAARHGIALSNFYRAASNPLVDRMITDLRMRAVGEGVPNFPKGAAGARAALAHLARHGFLGMLVDQKMNDGISVPFFGHAAMTAPAAAAFALRFRCPLIPAHTQRLGPARVRLIVEAPLALPNTGDRTADIATLTATMNAKLEQWIRDRPGEWLWLHRRWPR